MAIIAYEANPKSHTNRLFAGVVVITIFWLFANFVEFNAKTPEIALTSVRLVIFFAAAQIYGLFLLVHTFPGDKLRLSRTNLLLSSVYTLIVMGAALSPYLFTSIKSFDPIPNPTAGPAIPLFVFLVIAQFGGTIYLLIKKTRAASGILRQQLFYLSLGIIFTFGLIAVSNFVLVLVFNNTSLLPYTPVYTLILVGTTTYAITKHGLFNVKVVLAEIAAAALVFISILQIFLAQGLNDLAFKSAIAIATTIFSYLFVRSVQNEVKRREEIEKLAAERSEALKEVEQRNKNLATLQHISDVVLNESDMRIMTQKILDELPAQLDGCIGGLLSIVKDSHLAAYAITQTNQFSKQVVKIVGGDLEKYSSPINKEFNLLHKVLVDKQPADSENLADFVSPPIPRPVALTIQRLVGAKHVEAFPLYAGGEPFGVMMFVFSAAKETVHTQNYSIAKAISDDMSLAIQRAQAFQKLKDANEYLAELDKMKDEFISMASHELNTPLAAIEGYLSMILDEGMGGKIDAKTREYLSRAYASSKRLAELILDLLNVSRIEQGRLKMKFSECNLYELAESVIHELQIKADSKKIYLKLAGDKTKVPMTWCDPDRIREIFVNLAGNALKFTEKGGVTIMVEPGEGNAVRGSVTDTGRGIAKEDQKKLFQKFSQVKREIDEHQGTGLGLYISKNFVELHNGRLWVESDAGKGAKFIFELPILTEEPKEVQGAILERPINAPQIETGTKDVPKIITDSSKVSP